MMVVYKPLSTNFQLYHGWRKYVDVSQV